MGAGYQLVNTTKKETISFLHIPVDKRGEICLNHVASKIVTMYMLDNLGDQISFVPDSYKNEDWPLPAITEEDICDYNDVTANLLDKAEKEGFIKGRQKVTIDEDDPSLFNWKFDPSEY